MLNTTYDKNKRIYPAPCVITPSKSVILLPAHSNNVSDIKRKTDDWESIDSNSQRENKEPIQKSRRWPDGGINMPSSSNVIFPHEDDSEIIGTTKKIHDFTMDENPEDENDWGGMTDTLLQISEPTDIKYGPGNYPIDIQEFHHDLYAESKLKYTWIVPGLLAAGAHPILTLHQDDLSEFKKAGFKAIVSVLDEPLDSKYLKDFHYYFAPTVHGFVTDLAAICQFIDTQEALGNPVFIHSLNGKGRSAAVLAAYLVHVNYLTAKEAINYVRQHYDCSEITVAQEEAIFKFALQA